MTEAHIKEIEDTVVGWVATVPKWFGQRIKAASIALLIQRGLSDLNRLADAVEKLGSMEITRIGDVMHVGILPDAENAVAAALAEKAPGLSEIEKNAILGFVGFCTGRPGVLKLGSAYEVPRAIAVFDEYVTLKEAEG